MRDDLLILAKLPHFLNGRRVQNCRGRDGRDGHEPFNRDVQISNVAKTEIDNLFQSLFAYLCRDTLIRTPEANHKGEKHMPSPVLFARDHPHRPTFH